MMILTDYAKGYIDAYKHRLFAESMASNREYAQGYANGRDAHTEYGGVPSAMMRDLVALDI